jgi:hypothetical protein
MRRIIVTAATVMDIMIATAAAAGTVVMIAAAIMAGTVAVAGAAIIAAAGPSGAGTTASGSAAEPGPGRSISAPVILAG